MSSPAAYVRVVILTHAGADRIAETVRSVQATDWPADRLEILVIDNASTDGSGAIAASVGARVIRTDRNLGFPANNLGMVQPAEGGGRVDAFALLNDDVVVPPGWLAPLAETLFGDPERRGGRENEPRVAAVQPTLAFAQTYARLALPAGVGANLEGVLAAGADVTDRVQPIGGLGAKSPGDRTRAISDPAAAWVPVGPDGAEISIFVDGRRVELGHHAAVRLAQNAGVGLTADAYGEDLDAWTPLAALDEATQGRPRPVFGVCGGAALISARFVEEVGGFFEPLFLYYEDLDLSWRGRLRGWEIRHDPRSVVDHHHSATVGANSLLHRYWTTRNRLIVLTRLAPGSVAREAWLGELRSLAWHVRARLRRTRHRRDSEAGWRARALWAASKAAPAALRDRRGLRGGDGGATGLVATDALVSAAVESGPVSCEC